MKIVYTIALLIFLSGCGEDELSPFLDSYYTMIDLKGVGDFHLIKTDNDEVILIDVGDESSVYNILIPFLRSRKINHIDYIFISHAHKDHYGGLYFLLNSEIQIGTIYFNLPTQEDCIRESTGCSMSRINQIVEICSDKSIKLNSVEQGFELKSGETTIEVLYAFNNSNSPIGTLDLNDQSVILRVKNKNVVMLFTGDLNFPLGKYLAETSDQLKADILKVPHHGGAGIAPNEFFDKVDPELLLVPAPEWLWCSEKSDQVRNWAKENEVPTYISGIHGTVYFNIFDEGDILVNSDIPNTGLYISDCN